MSLEEEATEHLEGQLDEVESPENEENSTDRGSQSRPIPEHYLSFLSHARHISIFAAFGTIIRIFTGRFFGLDCDPETAVDDFLLPLTKHICITSSGKFTRGGALFTDLPANMIGSFLIGLVSPLVLSDGGYHLPWFSPEHHLQYHKAFHTAFATGLCGCLTTCKLLPNTFVVQLFS